MRPALVAALVISLSQAAAAQLQTGQRIRIRSSAFSGPLIGTLVTIAADTLEVRGPNGVQRIAARTIDQVEVSQGMGHRGGRGAALGAAIGAVPGAIWGWAAHQQCDTQSTCFVDSPLPEVVGGTLIGAAAGAGIGYFIGMRHRSERWHRTALSLAMLPSRLQVSIRF